jgi:membrane protein
MLGAEFNNAIQEEWPAPDTHVGQLRTWLEVKAAQKSEQRTNGAKTVGPIGPGDPIAVQAEPGAPPVRPTS